MKRTLILLGLGISAIAAAAGVVQFTFGRGVAANVNGRKGHFDFEVAKRMPEKGEATVHGRFHFNSIPTDAAPHRVSVSTDRIRLMNKNGNRATFGGRAVLRTIREGQLVNAPGTIEVHVIDNREPGHPGDPDGIEFVFTPREGEWNYSFGGRVVQGNIKVGQREL